MSPPGIFVLSVMSNDIQSIVIFVGYSEIEVTVDESPEMVVGADVGRSVVSIGSLVNGLNRNIKYSRASM